MPDENTGTGRSGPAHQIERSLDFDIICLTCAQRRSAHGSEQDATYTRQHLGPCERCGGPLCVERSDLGGISSPQSVLPIKFGT